MIVRLYDFLDNLIIARYAFIICVIASDSEAISTLWDCVVSLAMTNK